MDSGSGESILAWLATKSKINEMSYYWQYYLIFLRSLREGNYPLYIASLRKVIRWYFALDHYNYAKWIVVHIYDLLALPQKLTTTAQIFHGWVLHFSKN